LRAEKTLKNGRYIDINEKGARNKIREYKYEIELIIFKLYVAGGDIIKTIEKMIMDYLGYTKKIRCYASILYELGRTHWAEIFSSEHDSMYRERINIDALVSHEGKLNVVDIVRMYNYYQYKEEMAAAFLSSKSALRNLKRLSYRPENHTDRPDTHHDYYREGSQHSDETSVGYRNPHLDVIEKEHTDTGSRHEDVRIREIYLDVDIDQILESDF